MRAFFGSDYYDFILGFMDAGRRSVGGWWEDGGSSSECGRQVEGFSSADGTDLPTEEVQIRYRRGTRNLGERRERIMNKEQGMMNIEGRKCSMLNFRYSMFNEERWNWELGYWD
ncbi:hypothetical protein [Flavisolibacter tropicus]|uniref:Uncharacterized protein n=1 Tax=Flavisolibacter tropicus TaxID=1492898 RepID=A0A172U0T7_9BACT|nr:hypothetical protein [Flavisolibacter tropicus]ANE52930.1 hypothetical protein SY85_23075 [Flavisolibacter tropicus]